ncbi:asparagine synthase (glutamine-hydrolyzing) [Pleionea sp. CnH1-48]|uniref:asparagine synthase (glutamine-hydrolyzing) n=1 Tax=Pleionea sp. CnH1-48 TaxID=2954494 RepID=UPI002096B10D|nr:asparagine synthase (glutamine-hydrolyzing) [Pleionea sp. CnH1-48]MCO7224295.1 asparagine synthase (glutamine-hydrolyzing) [Pleionea sp. CnH1-48]
MCGIAGAISFNRPNCEQAVLELMSQALEHRGPDDESFYHDDFLSLAFRRLSIVDVEGGQQPIWDQENKVFVVVNGEIYNHKELRSQLKNEHHFSTESDSEIVLHLYKEYGVEAFSMLNGMFALAIWDTISNTLILARDRLGIKPMYYAHVSDTLIFASELKSLLLHPDCPKSLDWQDLEIEGLQQKADISTYVKDVHYLPAASFMVFNADQNLKVNSYWSLDSVYGSATDKTAKQLESDYLALLDDSVEKRLMSDVPLGIFLSGGIDSSLLTALAAKRHTNIHCFTVVERTTYRAGDVQQAKAITEQLGLPFYPIYFDAQKIAENFDLNQLEEMIYLIESPRFDPEWLFKSELHKAAKHYVPDLKVILLGQGADEFAGGYSSFLGSDNQTWQDYLNREVSESVAFYERYNEQIPERFFQYVQSNELERVNGVSNPCANYHKKMALLLNQLQFFNLWHEDRTSSYHSVESRVPFLDHRIVELLASVPESLQEELFWDKNIVRAALQESMSNYPQDKKKVPFFVTDDIASINEFAWTIAANVYPAFKDKYLSQNSSMSTQSYEKLYQDVIKRCHAKFDSAWQLINLMSLAIFSEYIKDAKTFLANFQRRQDAPLPLVQQGDWARLDEAFRQTAASPNSVSCLAEDLVNIPEFCEILNPLTEEEGNTCLILLHKGEEIRRIHVNDDFYWVVQVIDEMGRHIREPKSFGYWLGRSKAQEPQFFAIFNDLVEGGFLERIGAKA